MEDGYLIFILCILVEQLITIFKDFIKFIPKLPDKLQEATLQLISVGLGVVIAFATKANLFTIIGIESINQSVGIILAGLVISRGSNFAHDLFDVINKEKIIKEN